MPDFSDDRAQDLLALLNSHGQQFLSGFRNSVVDSLKRKADVLEEREHDGVSSDEGAEGEEEWGGIGLNEVESEEGYTQWHDV